MNPEDEARARELAEKSDASRGEILLAVERANDHLTETMRNARMFTSHDEIRPSGLRACETAKEAYHVLSDVDPTQEDPDHE